MDLTHITSRSLRHVLSLSEQKDRLVDLVAEIENEVVNVLSAGAAALALSPAKKTVPARKAKKRAPSRKSKKTKGKN
ncbi:MAG: hypothetical protein WCH98_11385 [Verrucomicrobiota bacterium]